MKNKVIVGLIIGLIISIGVNIYAIKSIYDISNYDGDIEFSFFNFKDRVISRINNLRESITEANDNLKESREEIKRLSNFYSDLEEIQSGIGETTEGLERDIKELRRLNGGASSDNIEITNRLRKLKEELHGDLYEVTGRNN